jgi:hypothetical protein
MFICVVGYFLAYKGIVILGLRNVFDNYGGLSKPALLLCDKVADDLQALL